MTFSDAIKKSVMDGFSGVDITTGEILTVLGITFLISLYIFVVYRVITKSAFYAKTFNISMAAISLVTAGIIMAMQSSLVISLGMVGALSIVRFRTAIKDPMDLLFLFWSIGTGIICGAGLFKIAIILSIAVTIAILVLQMIPNRRSPMLMIINSSNKNAEEVIFPILKSHTRFYRVKSRNITLNGVDIVCELQTASEQELVKAVSDVEGIDSVSLVAHDGELRG